MNFKKVEKAVKKINQLLENMRDEEQVSKIEKDLLLSYIRDLYEKATYTEEEVSKKTDSNTKQEIVKENISKPVEQAKSPTPAPVVEIADVVRQEIQDNTVSAAAPTPVQSTVETPSYVQNERSQAEIEAAAKKEILGLGQKKSLPQELEELFEKGSISELSDKLSQSPISDLTKCMGINERIFTVNELFAGDTGLFNTTMQELDKFTSLEQARDYLVDHVAVKQDWSDASKIKKATNFVKLISRRY